MIDAHVHFWQLGHHDCAWPTPDLAAIHRDFLPDDWHEAAARVGVSRAIAVQSQPSDRDTDWLLQLVDADPRIAGMVGWVDLASPEAPARIAALASSHAKLRGLRPMLQDLPEDDWILRSELAPAITAMLAHRLTFDALVRPRHLPCLLCFAERHPELQIVIDHAAKPDIAHGRLDPWRRDMVALAKLPNVYCKLSGLATEAGDAWQMRDLKPYVDHLLAVFGPQRLMWGSDWPVVNLVSDYAAWFNAAETLIALNIDDRDAILGGNAMRFYRLQSIQKETPCA